MKKNLLQYLLFFMVTLLFAVFFAFCPPPDNEDEIPGEYYKINSNAGFRISTDSKMFVDLAMHPEELLQPGQIRQSRPLFIWTAALFGNTITLFFNTAEMNKTFYFPDSYFFAYLSINVILLYGILIMSYRVFMVHNIPVSVAVLGIVMISCNDLSKAWFFVIHNQLFNLFTAVFSLYAVSMLRFNPGFKKYVLFSAVGGILLLAYGNFVVFFGVLFLDFFINSIKKKEYKKILIQGSILTAVFTMAYIAWILTCIYFCGSYYNEEADRARQIYWMYDMIKSGEFREVVIEKMLCFSSTMEPILMYLIPAILVWMYITRNHKRVSRNIQQLYEISMLVFFVNAGFWCILGYYAPRLTYNCVPPLVCWLCAGLSEIQNRCMPYFLYGISAVWMIYQFITPLDPLL